MDKPAGKDVRVLNPLWIISLFLAIAEITIGAVATQVHSWVQGLFAIFATAFPTGVAAVFFTILWKKPYVLYAPRDFPRHLDALDYVKAMLWARSAKEEGTESAVVAVVEAAFRKHLPIGVPATEADNEIEAAVETARHEYRKALIMIDLTEFPGLPAEVALPASAATRVADFLNQVWFYLEDYVEPFTYEQTWVLQEVISGRMLFTGFNLSRVEQMAVNDTDQRRLFEFGVGPGMTLKVLDRRAFRSVGEVVARPRDDRA